MAVVSKRGTAVTIKDVARAAGVGLMTVSRVINGVPGKKFSRETAQRVREAIDRLGYEPNHVARSLRGQKSGVIGVVTTGISDPFWASCARGVELEARKQNYVPILVAERRGLSAGGAAGGGTTGPSRGWSAPGLHLPGHRTTLTSRLANIPTVAMDRPISGFKTDCVLVHNHEAARNATRHLMSSWPSAHCLCGLWRAPLHRAGTHRRLQRAMKEGGLECLVFAGARDPEGAQLLAHEALSMKNPPTAIFASNTLVMHAIMLRQRISASTFQATSPSRGSKTSGGRDW